ncbi:hypothetical protein PP427_gp003 [Salmonella phage KM16]|nr:hypothetical protein PP427_gp003 [Salmonella phage KM16]
MSNLTCLAAFDIHLCPVSVTALPPTHGPVIAIKTPRARRPFI